LTTATNGNQANKKPREQSQGFESSLLIRLGEAAL
jgi:hypothetical protein